MKIFIFAPHFGDYSLNLATELAKRNLVCLFFNADNMNREVGLPLIKVKNCEFHNYFHDNKLARVFATPIILRRAAIFKPDIIHVHEHGDPVGSFVISMLTKIAPVIMTVHDPVPHSGQDSIYFSKTKTRIKGIRRKVHGFHVHGSYCKDALKTQINSDNQPIISTQHGLILRPNLDEIKKPLPYQVLLFGRMNAYKGVDTFLLASQKLFSQGINIRCVLAGRGPELSRLAHLISSLNFVTVLEKYLTPSEARAEFQKASIIVAPYKDATQSGVVSAAFANGRPVVATRVGGLVDSIKDGKNGLLVQRENIQELADSLLRLMEDNVLQKNFKQAIKRAASTEFSWKTIVEQLLPFYSKLIDVNKGKHKKSSILK